MLNASSLLAFSLPDVIFLLIVLAFFMLGVIRGLIKSMLSFFGTFACIALALLLTAPFSSLLAKTGLADKYNGMFERVLPKLSSVFSTDIGGMDVQTVLSTHGLPRFITKVLSGLGTSGSFAEGTTLARVAAPVFGGYLMSVTSFFILFVLFKIGVLILSRFSEKLNRVRVLGGINKLFGGLFGIARAFVVTFCILAVISFLPARWMKKPVSSIQNSAIVSVFYDNNLLLSAMRGTLSKGSIQKAIQKLID